MAATKTTTSTPATIVDQRRNDQPAARRGDREDGPCPAGGAEGDADHDLDDVMARRLADRRDKQNKGQPAQRGNDEVT